MTVMGDALMERLSDAGSIPARSILKGVSVNIGFYPLACKEGTIPEDSFFKNRIFCRIVSSFFLVFRVQKSPDLNNLFPDSLLYF